VVGNLAARLCYIRGPKGIVVELAQKIR